MAQLTKAQLAAQLEAAHVSYQALSTKYEALVAERAALTPQPTTVLSTVALTPYRQALALAKAQALRSGKCVSVTAR